MRKRKRARRMAALVLVAAGLAALLVGFTERLRPLLQQLAESKAESVTLSIINQQVNDLLRDQPLAYTELVTLCTGEDGAVTAVNTDMAKLNDFKALVAARVQAAFDRVDFGQVSLPVGTVIGGDFFLGRGPVLTFPIEMSCSVECSFANRFDDAGINQTRHQIMLQVTGRTVAVAPRCRAARTVTTNFIIAETVIVGRVPDYYTRVERSADPLADVNDYGVDPQETDRKEVP